MTGSESTGDRDYGGTEPVRTAHRFDETKLFEWLTQSVDGFRGPMSVTQFKGGQSNPTYRIATAGRDYVLRRKPPGALLSGAHAVDREARVLAALRTVGMPVPRVYGVCKDDGVLGTWFYVMELVAGRIFWDATFARVPQEQRPEYFDSMNATLAQLHTVDYAQLGLSDFGRPGNYFQRQIARWSKQYREDGVAGIDPHMDRLIEWLPQHIPDDVESSLVHGDYRCDNLIFHPTEPRIVAVLDWELATLGHPLADFSYHAMMYRMPPHIVAGLGGASLQQLNIPSEESYLAAYCRRTGRTDIPCYDFYVAFSFFRLAAIFHGIKGRVVRGTAVSAHARSRAEVFPEVAEIAWQQARKAGA